MQANTARFGSFCDLAAATRGWELDFRQLDRGRLDAELQQIGGEGVLLTEVRFNRRFDQRGGAPHGMRTLALLAEEGGAATWCGRRMTPTSLASFGAEGEFHAVSERGFRVHTIAIEEERLAKLADDLGLRSGFDRLPREGELFECDPRALDRIRRRYTLLGEACSRPGAAGSPELRRVVEVEIPALLLSALDDRVKQVALPSGGVRARAFEKARSFIDTRLDDPPAIREICEAVGVSWRTLDYAFREQAGMTPRSFLKALRLDAAHAALQSAGPAAKVADVANRLGFWHMGKFAADYRAQFGVLPSATLRR